MPRSIDHLVLAVPDLAAAAARYRALGFTVGSRNLHPWGTENAVVELEGAFLELVGLAEGFRAPAPDDPAAPFADLVAAAAARGGGLAAVAMSSEDADADATRFRAAGLGRGRRLDFARDAEAPDGSRRTLRFSLAFADIAELPEAGLFACRHHQTFGSGATPRHRNGALRLDAAVLSAAAPPGLSPSLSALFDTGPHGPPERPSWATPTGRLDVMGPADVAARYGASATPGRFAALGVVVASPGAVEALLGRAGVPHRRVAGAVVVPPEAAFGAALAFASAPCHSGRGIGGSA